MYNSRPYKYRLPPTWKGHVISEIVSHCPFTIITFRCDLVTTVVAHHHVRSESNSQCHQVQVVTKLKAAAGQDGSQDTQQDTQRDNEEPSVKFEQEYNTLIGQQILQSKGLFSSPKFSYFSYLFTPSKNVIPLTNICYIKFPLFSPI